MICVSATAIVWGWERAPVREGAAVAVRVAGRVCVRGAVGAAAVWAGVRAAVWVSGCVARRLGAGCGAGSSFCSVLAALVFSSPPSRRADHPGRHRVCLCVGGDPWGRGGHCHTCPGGGGGTASDSPPRGGGDSGAKARPPGRGPGGPRGGDPQPPGGGAAARRSALCCLGLRASPSPSSRPECQTGGGDEPMTPPSRFPWKPRGGDAAPPPRSGTRRTPAALGADSPAPSSSSSSPRLIRPPPAPARVWRGVKSAQVRGPGSPPSSGHPRVLSGSQSQGYAGTAGVAGCC